jgi:hypothetical protein
MPNTVKKLNIEHCNTNSGDVVSGTPRLSGIRTHNFSGDRNGLSSIFTKKKAPKNYSNYEEFSQRTFNIGNLKNWDLFY